LLPQLRLGPRVGMVLEQARHAMFYPNVLRSLVVWAIGYYNTPLGAVLPEWAFYTSIPLLYIGAILFHHIVLHKAWIEFTTGQGADEEANPQFRKMVDDHDDIRERLRRLEREHGVPATDGGDEGEP